MPKNKKEIVELPEEEDEIEIEDEDEFTDEEEEDGDFMDMGGLLSSLLTSSEGDNVCTAILKMTLVLQKNMETQNKILVKILTALNDRNKKEES